jgi:hypothetical protein
MRKKNPSHVSLFEGWYACNNVEMPSGIELFTHLHMLLDNEEFQWVLFLSHHVR